MVRQKPAGMAINTIDLLELLKFIINQM